MGKKANYTLSKRIVLTLKDLKSPRTSICVADM